MSDAHQNGSIAVMAFEAKWLLLFYPIRVGFYKLALEAITDR
jgi:hypothetical protein